MSNRFAEARPSRRQRSAIEYVLPKGTHVCLRENIPDGELPEVMLADTSYIFLSASVTFVDSLEQLKIIVIDSRNHLENGEVHPFSEAESREIIELSRDIPFHFLYSDGTFARSNGEDGSHIFTVFGGTYAARLVCGNSVPNAEMKRI